ncbi:MAG TPA: aminopeptidase P family N-terminal domain-containing protein, partial [Halanaerobiales bacterium]|nr:aminopeptidase P family N-terminal domain-containing protein [Halanaerobiales bacterium]
MNKEREAINKTALLERRIARTKNGMEELGLDGLLIETPENRFYLTGFTGTAGRVLFTSRDSYFITDFRYTAQAKREVKGYKIIEIREKFEQKLLELLEDEGVKKLGFEDDLVTYRQYEKYQEYLTGMELVPTEGVVKGLRLCKDQLEIERVQSAVEITDRAFKYILGKIEPGRSERELALELEFFLKKEGGSRNAFDFIVASGKRSSMPHGVASN